MSITRFLVRLNLPLHIVDTDAWKDFLFDIHPEAKTKCSSTLAKYKVPLLHNCLRDAMKKKIENDLNGQAVTLTTDHWTSKPGDSFQCFTIHYVCPMWRLFSYTLKVAKFKGKHTGVNIGKEIDKLISLDFPVLKTSDQIFCVVDGAANMRSGLSNAKFVKSLGSGSLQCIDHKLNNILQIAVEADPTLKAAIQKLNKFTTRLSHSAPCRALLSEACQDTQLTYKVIPKPCKTRWNSHCIMIQTMVQMKEAILNLNVYDISNHFEKVLLTHGDITPLEEILPILQTIKKTSEWMSCDKEVRNDFALVRIKSLFLTLRKEIQKDAGSHSYKAFLNKALDLLTEKFPLEGAKISALALGHLFNPVVRGSLLPDDLKESMINLLIEEHESTPQFRENKLVLVEPELLFEPSDDPCEENMAELLNTSLAAQGSLSLSSMEIEPLRSEFNDYALLPRVGTSTDILEWWRNNEKVIPMLAKIARGVLAIPPTFIFIRESFFHCRETADKT